MREITAITTDSRKRHPEVPFPLPQHESSTLVVAPKGSGKTNMIVSLLMYPEFYHGYFHRIIVISGNVLSDDKWDLLKETKGVLVENKRKKKLLGELPPKGEKKVPKVVFKDEEAQKDLDKKNKFDGRMVKTDFITRLDDLKPFLKEQRKALREIRKKLTAKGKDVKDAKMYVDRMLVVIDDMAGQFPGGKNTFMGRFTIGHRHLCTSILCVTQALKLIPPPIRTNMNALVLFEIPNAKELEAVYEEWPENMSFEDWIQAYEAATEDEFGFLYLNNHFRRGKRAFKNFTEQLSYKRVKYSEMMADGSRPNLREKNSRTESSLPDQLEPAKKKPRHAQ